MKGTRNTVRGRRIMLRHSRRRGGGHCRLPLERPLDRHATRTTLPSDHPLRSDILGLGLRSRSFLWGFDARCSSGLFRLSRLSGGTSATLRRFRCLHHLDEFLQRELCTVRAFCLSFAPNYLSAANDQIAKKLARGVADLQFYAGIFQLNFCRKFFDFYLHDFLVWIYAKRQQNSTPMHTDYVQAEEIHDVASRPQGDK